MCFVLFSELNTSVKALQYEIKPEVPKSEGRRLFFDTHAVVRLLEDNGLFCFYYLILNHVALVVLFIKLVCLCSAGFTPQQAEVIVKLLLRTTNSNLDIIYSDMVTKVQQVRLEEDNNT